MKQFNPLPAPLPIELTGNWILAIKTDQVEEITEGGIVKPQLVIDKEKLASKDDNLYQIYMVGPDVTMAKPGEIWFIAPSTASTIEFDGKQYSLPTQEHLIFKVLPEVKENKVNEDLTKYVDSELWKLT